VLRLAVDHQLEPLTVWRLILDHRSLQKGEEKMKTLYTNTDDASVFGGPGQEEQSYFYGDAIYICQTITTSSLSNPIDQLPFAARLPGGLTVAPAVFVLSVSGKGYSSGSSSSLCNTLA
jgi:hypothetical protein